MSYNGISAGFPGVSRGFFVARPGAKAFVHEFGHNLGAGHEHGGNEPTGAFFSFSHAHRDSGFQTALWSTGNNYKLFFSNPAIALNGKATGVTIGEEGEADNAETIRRCAPVVARYYEASTSVARLTVRSTCLETSGFPVSEGHYSMTLQGRCTVAPLSEAGRQVFFINARGQQGVRVINLPGERRR